MGHEAVEAFGRLESLGLGPNVPLSQEALMCQLQGTKALDQASQPLGLQELVRVCVCVITCACSTAGSFCWREGPIFGIVLCCHV